MTRLHPRRFTVSKMHIWFCIPRSLISIMVLTRATLEKLGKEELISMFLNNYEKLNNNLTNLTNQLAQVHKTLKRTKSQVAVIKSFNKAFQNQIISLEDSVRKINRIYDESVLKFQTLLIKLRCVTYRNRYW